MACCLSSARKDSWIGLCRKDWRLKAGLENLLDDCTFRDCCRRGDCTFGDCCLLGDSTFRDCCRITAISLGSLKAAGGRQEGTW